MRPMQHNVGDSKGQQVDPYESDRLSNKGLKYDKEGKKQYYAMPIVLLDALASVFEAGERKYETFNCLQPFEDSDRRFWDATMRHLKECQINPLARDEETGCYHGAQAAFNMLLRIYNAEMRLYAGDVVCGDSQGLRAPFR